MHLAHSSTSLERTRACGVVSRVCVRVRACVHTHTHTDADSDADDRLRQVHVIAGIADLDSCM